MIVNLVNLFWRWFISLRLTFVLLGFISLGAVIGMSYDQTLSYDEFYQNQTEGLAAFLLNFFELYDAFHSWWFSLAILLLALNLIACSIERLPRIYFDYVRPRPYLTERRLLGLNLKQKLVVADLPQAQMVVEKYFGKKLSSVKLLNGDYYFQDKEGIARFGVYVVHIALLIIMFSSIYATQNGVDGHVLIEEGKMARFITAKGAGGVNYTYDLGFYVGCEDFRLRTFVDNSPMEFESDLYISDNGIKSHEQTVRVNEPLSYAGFTFYQSSYRPIISEKMVRIEVTDLLGKKEHFHIKLNSPIKLASGEVLLVEKIYDDFAGLGQAIRIKETLADSSTYFHVFRRYPQYDEVRKAGFKVTFIDIDQEYATGLSVGKVPGISIIFSGFLLLVLGLYLCFFMHPIRFFARIEKRGEIYEVWLAAQGFRHQNIVKEIFFKQIETFSKVKYA